jgi:glycosidase
LSVKIINYIEKTCEFLVKFTYEPLTSGAHRVFITGDFNNFAIDANKMEEKNGLYETTIMLKKGKYAYKFIVDNIWITDEDVKEFTADGFGGQNSILYVGDPKDINALRIVEFTYIPEGPVSEVYIAGTFNNWDQKSDRLEIIEDKFYKIKIPLKTGLYYYRFIVDNVWMNNKNSTNLADNNIGEKNSVIYVDETFPLLDEKNILEIITFGLSCNNAEDCMNQISANTFEFKARTFKNNVEKVVLLIDKDRFDMQLIASDNNYNYFKKKLTLKEKEFDFCFIYKKGVTELYSLKGGFSSFFISDKMFHFSQTGYKRFFTPDWVKEGIIYQIFIDRFFNGDVFKNQDFSEWYYKGLNLPPASGEKLRPGQEYYHFVEDWYDIKSLQHNPLDPDGKPDTNSFYGGDIAGVYQKLDYLEDLGITIIYFNPIFEARSNHKYDAADYKKIDPHFGSENEFKLLVKECHKRGIRIILDVAFNHTGDTFRAFREAKQKGPESEYYHWYEWKKWPLPENWKDHNPSDYYNCWWGFPHMPDLDFDKSRFTPFENRIKDIKDADPNWDVVNYLLEVAEYWLKDMDIDGFRLDVPNEVPFWFWKLFREKVKKIKPDAYLVGEIWHNAMEWVNNEIFDAVMNYAYFKDPVIRFFNLKNYSAEEFDRALKPGLMNYPIQASQVMMNLFDSHDTFRFLEIANGNINKLKLAVLFQMTYIGVPHIWYGDEIAMRGEGDPDCRRPFNWKYKEDKEKVKLRKYYKKLIKIRKENKALTSGNFQTLLYKDKIYGFLREYENARIIVVINNDEVNKEISIPINQKNKSVRDLLTNNTYAIRNNYLDIKIDKNSGIILNPDNAVEV